MQKIRIYEIKKEYIKYLSQYQKHIFYDDGTRKYIGILLEIKEFKYFAPLSSFKPKHNKMVETIDFIKIKDYAVININNMIPVPDGQYALVDVNGTKDPHYKYLLQAESREINRRRNKIIKNAQIVYSHKLRSENSTMLAKRTNNFGLLEQKCKQFML